MVTKQLRQSHVLLLRMLADDREALERRLVENAAMRDQVLLDGARAAGVPDGISAFYDAENMSLTYEELRDGATSPAT